MKKSFTLFLALLIAWFSVAMHQCICPPEIAQASSTISPQLWSSAEDICNDCGHTRSCCTSQDQPAAVLSAQADLNLECVMSLVAVIAARGDVPERPVVVGFSDRGPPPGRPPTLLNQKTLLLL
ncbi:MAG: hypothetical protein C0473_01505 [Cyanobacteria bacterium DS3.002]|nr:hypothetical protein [Cyanobacteria bacterium DS3.002]MBA4049600.1 hypothetical protein [Cyanobacteria bacterium DS2.008]MBA4075458.1 hypothetical protein [Cyanobacteria bacterium PR.023]